MKNGNHSNLNNNHSVHYKEIDYKIRDAFIDLLEKKSFDKISIISICKKANVSRTCFYKHFYDKYDLLDHMNEYAMEDVYDLFFYLFDNIKTLGTAEVDQRIYRFFKLRDPYLVKMIQVDEKDFIEKWRLFFTKRFFPDLYAHLNLNYNELEAYCEGVRFTYYFFYYLKHQEIKNSFFYTYNNIVNATSKKHQIFRAKFEN